MSGAFPEDTRAFDVWGTAHVPGFVATLCAQAKTARQAVEVGAYGRARIPRAAAGTTISDEEV